MHTYRYLEDIATADIAFEAIGDSIEELFLAACDATMNVMVEDLQSIRTAQRRMLRLEDRYLDMLLFSLLQELIYYKDAERLLLRVGQITIREDNGRHVLEAEAAGEMLDQVRHELRADVKAVTLHRFVLKKEKGRWKALVILDV
jgi:SHS2 domain-containing protein